MADTNILNRIGARFKKVGLDNIGRAVFKGAIGVASGNPVAIIGAVGEALGLGEGADEAAVDRKLSTMSDAQVAGLVAIKNLEAECEIERIKAEVAFEDNVTARHDSAMKYGTTLNKIVRPVQLLIFSISYLVLIYIVVLGGGTPEEKESVIPFMNQLLTLLSAVFTFYFGGRTWEKLKGKA